MCYPVAGPVIQGEALARGVLRVRQVPRLPRRQAVRLQGRPHLLRAMLRRAVRHQVRRLRGRLQGRWVWLVDNQE